jgi:hypothetical protein
MFLNVGAPKTKTTQLKLGGFNCEDRVISLIAFMAAF